MDNSLFSEEILNATIADNAVENKGPVKVLGMEFANDDERRAYFREELRKKLPELKQIEGFPIGEDDDIINLSDPPYYTACPNPWLNDFIAEWEKEKVQLEAEGKRSSDFEVKEPYASDVSEGKNNPIYMAHGYHTKVPHPAIMRYILHYTQPGDVIYDGFSGTGMTGVAAQACGNPTREEVMSIEMDWQNLFSTKPQWGIRHAICGDLSPFASLIGYNYNTPTDHSEFKKEIARIAKELNEESSWMYETVNTLGEKSNINFAVWSDVLICPNCGEPFMFWTAALDTSNKCLKDEPQCPHCNCIVLKDSSNRLKETTTYGDEVYNIAKDVPAYIVTTKRKQYEATSYDSELAERINQIDIPYFYPQDILPKGNKTSDPINSHNITHTHLFYTKRNLYVLSAFLDKIKSSPLFSKMAFLFTGMINRSTKMNRFSPRNFFYGGGGWCLTGLNGTLYVPSLPMEVSVLEQLNNKSKAYDSLAPLLPKAYSNLLQVASATSVTLGDNTVDYIFTDPPFGANIMYSELNYLPESWLRIKTNNDKEAIVSSAQRKTLFEYQQLMHQSFTEYYRVLKPGKWITIEFSNTSASVWNSIQNALQGVGFVVANVAALDKKQGSFNAVTSTTAVKQDLVITCFKPSASLLEKFTNTPNDLSNIWDFIDEYLIMLPVHIEKGNATTTVIERNAKILYDRLISYYIQKGLPVPIDAHDFQSGLRERYVERDGMYFTTKQVVEYEDKKRMTVEFVPMGLIVSSEADGIEWLNNRLKNPQTYSEIQPDWLQAINGVRKNDILPELNEILEQNFIQDPNGKWRLPNIQDDVDKALLRTKALLKEFKIYVEVAQKPKAKLKEVRVEAVRAGFKQCYIDKDFQTIVMVGDKIPQNLLTEDEILLQFYDIAVNHV